MTEVTKLEGHSHWVRAMVATSTHLYTGSYNAVVMWSLTDFSKLQSITTTGGAVYSLAVDLAKEYLIIGAYENMISVRPRSNRPGGTERHPIRQHSLAKRRCGTHNRSWTCTRTSSRERSPGTPRACTAWLSPT